MDFLILFPNSDATPMTIASIMRAEGVTTSHIKSHLQACLLSIFSTKSDVYNLRVYSFPTNFCLGGLDCFIYLKKQMYRNLRQRNLPQGKFRLREFKVTKNLSQLIHMFFFSRVFLFQLKSYRQLSIRIV